MSLSTQPYKGARDFYPEDKRLQNFMFDVMRRTVKSYGYQEYDAPILEPLDLYKAKTGEEIVNEQTYTFTDRGGREVAIRPEMTPTVSRMVAGRRQELAYPLRWFSIPNLWRYERPQRGRLREHWQLNVDIFGEPGLPADHEIIAVADAILKDFGASSSMYQIKINSRKLIDSIMGEHLKLNANQSHDAIKLIDRMAKMELSKFESALNDIVGDKTSQLIDILRAKNFKDLPKGLASHPSVTELEQLLKLLDKTGIDNAVFDISLMRGFDYYTDIVFEVYDTNPENNRSMFGGGRYDGLVGLFGVEPVPTVGFGMGDVTLANFLDGHKLLPLLKSDTEYMILTVDDTYEHAFELLQDLRKAGKTAAVDATDRKLDKKLKNAEKSGVSKVIFVGPNEVDSGVFKLKNLETGDTAELARSELIKL